MKQLLLLACSAVLVTGCYTYDTEYRSGDVVSEPAGAELEVNGAAVGDPVPGETWSEDPRDINQRPYRYQFETERHQQYGTDPEFTHDRLD